MSSPPGAVDTTPDHGSFHSPAITVQCFDVLNVGAISDSWISTSWRVFWQSWSASIQPPKSAARL